MAMIGQRATLRVVDATPHGLQLDAGESLGRILLPRGEMPSQWEIGDDLDVFIYLDSEDRPVATLKSPIVMPNSFGRLKCVDLSRVGAFLDWGLAKDLLLPFREQSGHMEVGKFYLVHVHVDKKSGRIAASTRLARYLDTSIPPFEVGAEVDLMVYAKTPLGYKAIIDGKYSGLLFADAVFQNLQQGEQMRGYIAATRSDGKIDLSLHPPGRSRVEVLEEQILAELKARGGFWAIGDHTPAEEIHDELGCSKRTFKQATGSLFRRRIVDLTHEGIRLLTSE